MNENVWSCTAVQLREKASIVQKRKAAALKGLLDVISSDPLFKNVMSDSQ